MLNIMTRLLHALPAVPKLKVRERIKTFATTCAKIVRRSGALITAAQKAQRRQGRRGGLPRFESSPPHVREAAHDVLEDVKRARHHPPTPPQLAAYIIINPLSAALHASCPGSLTFFVPCFLPP